MAMTFSTGKPTFLNTNASSVKLSTLSTGSSGALNMFPKSGAGIMNTARRNLRSVSVLQAWKKPTKREHFLGLYEEDFNNAISVVIVSGSDEDVDFDLLHNHSSAKAFADYVLSSRREGLPLDRYELKEDDDALHLKVEFPGLNEEALRVNFVKGVFIIRVVELLREKTTHIRKVIGLPIDKYKVEKTKAAMRNGVLKLVIPKKKKDKERKDITLVEIVF